MDDFLLPAPRENLYVATQSTLMPMQTALKIKLSTFMFLQYFIWGSWYVSMGTFLGKTLKFEGGEIGLAYGAFAIGAMIAPFFVGLIADRYFASEKLLAVLGVLGGVVLCVLPHVTHFTSFYATLIVYCALYAPTLALGNSLSFQLDYFAAEFLCERDVLG